MNPGLIPLGLYVHLPFCLKRCPYCDFNAHAVGDFSQEGLFDAYIQCLLDDLEQQAEALSALNGRQIDTIFLGGGTPSLFEPAQLERLLLGIAAIWPLRDQAEITLEANPGTAESARFKGYRSIGINRLSIGVQSFSDESLARLQRVHDAKAAHLAVSLAKEAGFNRLNLDLMFGLPGQTREAALQDLAAALHKDPGHISWYQLTLEPNTVFARFPPRLPAEPVLEDMNQAGLQLLDAACPRYEVSAFARKRHACQHNLNYWQFGDYLAAGAGGHGKLTLPNGEIVRYQRSRSPRDYMAAPARPLQFKTVSRAELPLEFLMNALRLAAGVPHELFTERTGLPLEVLAPFMEAAGSKALLEPDRLKASRLGYDHLNTLLSLI